MFEQKNYNFRELGMFRKWAYTASIISGIIFLVRENRMDLLDKRDFDYIKKACNFLDRAQSGLDNIMNSDAGVPDQPFICQQAAELLVEFFSGKRISVIQEKIKSFKDILAMIDGVAPVNLEELALLKNFFDGLHDICKSHYIRYPIKEAG